MIPDCFVWIRELLFPPVNILISPPDKGFGPLPDDILIDVLSRLPAYEVLKCRVVCNHWCALTSSRHFIELQSIRAPTIILGECHSHELGNNYMPRYFSFDGNAKMVKKLHPKSVTLLKYYNPIIICSFGGLLVFMGDSIPVMDEGRIRSYIVLNPNSHESKSITITRPTHSVGVMIGVFFHPLACEYRFILVENESNHDYPYYIYGSKSKIWRNITTTSIRIQPPYCAPPVVLNMGLHWILDNHCLRGYSNPCEHSVLVFKMDSEEFGTLPHPNFECGSACHDRLMDLFEMEKQLCLGHIVLHAERMDIWILEDYANWCWVKRHSIRINHIKFSWGFVRNSDYWFLCRLKILSMQKDKLLINWFSRELYLCHLTRNTLRRIEDKHKSSGDNYYHCTAYTTRLATLDI